MGVPVTTTCDYGLGHAAALPVDHSHGSVEAPLRYVAKCLTHNCQGHPNIGPLYMALHVVEALPSELDPHSAPFVGTFWCKCSTAPVPRA